MQISFQCMGVDNFVVSNAAIQGVLKLSYSEFGD
jgi:hypothetical protein